MNMLRRWGAFAVIGLCLSACTSTTKFVDTGFKAPPGHFSLLLMKPDVEVDVLTVGGLNEPNQQWTEQARASLFSALEANSTTRGGNLIKYTTVNSTSEQVQTNNDLENLHRAVAQSIALHKYGPATLPTKKDKFDWTLGPDAQSLGLAAKADYALFLYARDSFSSDTRVAMKVLLAVGSFGLVQVPGGERFVYASLVDLKTGNIVWFNVLSSTSGDIRSSDGAVNTVDTLLETMPLGLPQHTQSRWRADSSKKNG